MFKDEFQAMCNIGKNKINLFSTNLPGYFVSAIMAGLYVAFGSFVAYSVGTPLSAADSPVTRVIMAAAFSVALSLVICAGAELFTGNVLVFTSSALRKEIPWRKHGKASLVCYIGNFAGSLIAAGLFQLTGIANGPIGDFFAASAATKMSYSPLELFTRALLCNMLVCLAVWCSIKLKSESGKLILVFLCIFTFMVCGFEHSIANMGILAIGLLNPGAEALSLSGYGYNLALATLGNIVGGLLITFPYYLISKDTTK